MIPVGPTFQSVSSVHIAPVRRGPPPKAGYLSALVESRLEPLEID